MSDPEDPDYPEDEAADRPIDLSEVVTEDAASLPRLRKSVRDKKRKEGESETFWKRVFADPVGRREMWGILQAAHTFDTQFACGPTGFPQPESTWFKAGEQALGQRLYQSWARIDRAGVFLMQDEHDERFKVPTKK